MVVYDEENRREDVEALAEAGVPMAALSSTASPTWRPPFGPSPGWWAPIPTAWRSSPLPGRPALRAFVPVWRRPWMSLAGETYGSSLLAAIGVDNVFADADDRYPR